MANKNNGSKNKSVINRQHIIIQPKKNWITLFIIKIKQIMKKINLLVAMCLMAIATTSTSCAKEFLCDGKGTLTVKNSSLHTVQQIVISGTDYGTIDPGESKEIDLTAGTWKLKFVGISGGEGCTSESEFVIDACGELGRQCSY